MNHKAVAIIQYSTYSYLVKDESNSVPCNMEPGRWDLADRRNTMRSVLQKIKQ